MITSVSQPWVTYIERKSPQCSARAKALAHWGEILYRAAVSLAMIFLLGSLIFACLVQEAPFQRIGSIVVLGLIPATSMYLFGRLLRAALNATSRIQIRSSEVH
jgi:hypothetical protein